LKASKEVEVLVERLVDGHMEAKVKIKRRLKDIVLARTKMEIAHIIIMIKIIETKEEEEAFMEPFFNVEKKDIEPMSVLNIKEGQIKYLKIMLKLPMWMKM
jgi:hypothetical protein